MERLIFFTTTLMTSLAFADSKGPLTPSAVKYTFNSAQLTKFDNSNYGLFQTPMEHTFRRTDPDFGNVELKDITVAFGRYKSISLCYDTDVAVTINGSYYRGLDGGMIERGDQVWGQINGTVAPVNPGVIHEINVSLSSDAQNCTTTYFKHPLCVVADGEDNDCEAGDDIYTAEGKIDPNTGEVDLGLGAPIELQISFLMDMLHGVIINAESGAVETAPAVRVVMGKPGAAIHLGKWDNNGATDVSMIFSNDRTLLSVMSSEYPGTHSPGFCNGQSNAYVSSVPAASPLPTNAINFITFFDDSISGKVAYPTVSSCLNAGNCAPVGFNIFNNVTQEIASPVSVSCVDENSVDVPLVLLDYGYDSIGAGEAGGPQTFEVQRIVDPNDMFNICGPGRNGQLGGKPGSCAFVGADVDGY